MDTGRKGQGIQAAGEKGLRNGYRKKMTGDTGSGGQGIEEDMQEMGDNERGRETGRGGQRLESMGYRGTRDCLDRVLGCKGGGGTRRMGRGIRVICI
jgi:hypothetical protein